MALALVRGGLLAASPAGSMRSASARTSASAAYV